MRPTLKNTFWQKPLTFLAIFWVEFLLKRIFNKTSIELWKNRKSNISYCHIFGCYCYILNHKDNLEKFDSRSDKGIFLGYSTTTKAYGVYNLRTKPWKKACISITTQSQSPLRCWRLVEYHPHNQIIKSPNDKDWPEDPLENGQTCLWYLK